MHIHNKLKIQTYLTFSIALAGIMHVLFGIYFAFLGIFLVVALNFFDVLVYIVTFFINRAGKTRIASFILLIKISVFSLTATFLFGTSVNAHWFVMVAALPAVLYLDFTKIQKICIAAALPVLLNLQLSFPIMFYPPFDMSDNTFLSFSFANIVVLSGIFVVALNVIITHRISAMQLKEIDDIRHISNIDPLTELNNRRSAEDFFEKLVSDNQTIPSVFCLIDIDDFKLVNDTYGHDAGDIVLSTVANILRNNTRQTDLVCRWGGEEFLVVLPKCSFEVGQRILEKIRKSIEDEVFPTEAADVKVTITGGASALTDGDIKSALSACDKNLYEGKRNGKNQIVV